MSFDVSVVTPNTPTWGPDGLRLSWTTTAPAGTWYQVYVGGKLAKWTQALTATVPYPGAGVRIDIGAVDAANYRTDYSSSLPTLPLDRATLSWLGGTYLDPTGNDDVAGFRIYGESTPGGGVDYVHPLDQVPAYSAGVITDGYGLGGYGLGGFGRSASSYTWTSRPLTSGTWAFAIVPYDGVGNEGTPMVGTVSISAAPRPVAPNAAGQRLTYAYDPATRRATLTWSASPDEGIAISVGGGLSLMGMI